MRILKLFTGIALISIDLLLILTFPFRYVAGSVEKIYYLLASLGIILYTTVHIVRKPEAFYVWNHEFSHLLASKLFMRDVKGFHITRKRGGKVVIDRTNFIIDLSPYIIFPLAIIIVFLALLMRRAGFPEATSFYFLTIGYMLGMMFLFTAEAFFTGQEDIRRNGLLFSASIIFLCNFIFLPAYLLPGVTGKKIFLDNLTTLWWKNISVILRHVPETASAIYQSAGSFVKR